MAFSTDGVTCPCTATNTTGCSSLKKCGSANLKYKELCNADGWGFTNCANDKYGILKCLTKGKKINFYPKFSVVRIKSLGVATSLVICSRFIHRVSFAATKNVAIPKPGTACTDKITFPVKVLNEFRFI